MAKVCCSLSRLNHFIQSPNEHEKAELSKNAFSPLLALPDGKVFLNLIYCLVERFDMTKKTFKICDKHIKFFINEMTIILGLWVGEIENPTIAQNGSEEGDLHIKNKLKKNIFLI